MFRRLMLALGILSLCGVPAFAGYRPFTFTYDTYPMVKGEIEFEQWVTYLGHKPDEHGYTRIEFREEIEYGLTDNFRLSAYVPNWAYENSKEVSGVRFDSVGLEGIWLLSNPVTDAIGVGLYGEINIGEHDLELEQKLLLHKDWGKWTVAYNLVFETELEDVFGGGDTEVEGVLGNTFGVAYSLSPQWRSGAEVIVESIFRDWTKYETTTVYAGPVISYQGSQIKGTNWSWWVTFTPTFQLTGEKDAPDFQFRLIASISF
jgi:hypothetical protein